MTISRTTFRVGVFIGTIAVAIALAAPIQASSPKPIGMSKAEHRALMLRSEALNRKYHLGSWAVAPASASTSTAGFSWSAFGIGATAMLAGVLLAGGVIVGGRHGRRVPRTRVSS